MGTVNVVQYDAIDQDNTGGVQPQIAKTPAISSENVTSGATSAQSSVFSDNTKLVLVSTDTTIRITFGTDPAAAATSERLVADASRYYGVRAGQKLAVINE